MHTTSAKARAPILALLLAAFAWPAAAQRAGEFWSDLPPQARPQAGKQPWVQPAVHRAVGLNMPAMRAKLARAPFEGRVGPLAPAEVLELPAPDGRVERFRVVESPVMAPELAAKFPEIKTYLGQGIDDPAATLRCDVTPSGFHAQVITPHGWWYVDPRWRGDDSEYAVYLRRDHRRTEEFVCLTPPRDPVAAAARTTGTDMLAIGGTLRTYRIAVAATAEYTAFHGGTVSAGMAAIVTAINRVTGVYEADLGVRLVLVANNNLLVYTSANSDPYSNNNASSLLTQNQSNLDAVIGNANYDIGHVFSTAGGGLAGLGVVCVTGSKARGETGTSSPTGDAFYIDYVAHEIGHQFDAEHTFNSVTGNCSGNRSSGSAYEVGSGTTIMAYAGICGSDNVQAHSDPYFLWHSFDQIVAFVTSTATCSSNSSTGNNPPSVSAGANHTIPRSTPFALTASGSDADGDTLTYSWEERDLGAAQALTDTDNGASPLFRVFNPSTNASRTFPKLSAILSNGSSPGERLPTTSRLLKFRVVARDNRAGGGGVASADKQLTVDSNSGPFLLTTPNSATNWSGLRTVTWDVAGTAGSPVNCAAVNIRLSTDGGNSFPYLLAAGTPNDGVQDVVLPNINTTMARIKVEAADNVFFDISNTNFTIVPGVPTPLVTLDGTVIAAENCVMPNAALDPDETVTVQFALKNVGTGNTTNVIATLRATNGVSSPSAPQSYGALGTNGTPVARPFTFTATGICGGTVTCVFDLADGTNGLGVVSNTFILGKLTAVSAARTNNLAIAIPATGNRGVASPYPSTIVVSNFSGTISKVRVTLNGLSHSYPADLDILLVSPAGQKVMLISDAGGASALSSVTLVFDDDAAAGLPDATAITSGTYRPTDYAAGETMTAPAPAGPYTSSLAAFNGADPNGTWSLYALDDQTQDTGSLQGWSLEIENSTLACCSGASMSDVRITGSAAPNPVIVGSNVTFTLTVTNAGPDTASVVSAASQLPSGATFVSASATLGNWSNNAGLVQWSVATIPNAGSAALAIVAHVTQSGTLSNLVSVGAAQPDPALANNSLLLTLNVPFDNDNDGVADAWEFAHGLDPSNPADAALDLDGDGLTTLHEYLAGTDPDDPRNFLGIIAVNLAGTNVHIAFSSVSGKSYRVEGADDVVIPAWVTVADNIPGTGATVTVTNSGAAILPQRTYRVRLLP